MTPTDSTLRSTKPPVCPECYTELSPDNAPVDPTAKFPDFPDMVGVNCPKCGHRIAIPLPFHPEFIPSFEGE